MAAQTSKTTDPASKATTEEESKENGQATDAGEEKEKKEIQAVEKSVQIRLCNYSMLVRAS